MIDLSLYEENLPVFQAGVHAREVLESGDADGLSRAERSELRARVHAGEDAFMRIYRATEWVSRRLVREEMARPRSFHVVLDEDELMQAAMEGVYRMCVRADVKRMKSAVNYLMSWIKTSVERAACKEEASYGMTSSQVRLNRKIAAVRARMRRENGVEPTDEDVYAFFQSGKADVRTKYGRKQAPDDKLKQSKENRRITLRQIQAQHEVDSGTPMKFAVSDETTVERDTSRLQLQAMVGERDPLGDNGQSIQAYWAEYMSTHGIDPDQMSIIAETLNLYPVNHDDNDDEQSRTRRSMNKWLSNASELSREFTLYMQTREGNIAQWTRQWTQEHGDGGWLPFLNVPVMPDRELFPWYDPDQPETADNTRYHHLIIHQPGAAQ